MGQAAALAVVLFLAVLVVTLGIFRSSRIWVYYEGSEDSNQ
jgi:ABC-type sugar transport system permease subunit